MCVCLFTGESHMAITHDALGLTIQGTKPLNMLNVFNLDRTLQGHPVPGPSQGWKEGGSHLTGMLSCT